MKNKKQGNAEGKEAKAGQPAAAKKVDQQTIDNHRQAAASHIEAAKHHMDAAKHYETGNHKKAAFSTILAMGHHAIAGEFLSDDAKHHAQVLKQTKYNKSN